MKIVCSKKEKSDNIVGYWIILLIGLLLLANTQLSFSQNDESFYLSLVHRLWSGDRLILDEWHPTQFYAPILLPFYCLYRFIVPAGTGVYLYARILYVLFAVLVSLFVYNFLGHKSRSWFFNCTAALLPLLYARANIQGPSYYNLCLQFCLLALILSDSAEKNIGFSAVSSFLLLSCAIHTLQFSYLWVSSAAYVLKLGVPWESC